ncbi:MAG: preprotein translocase subunit SecE [Patescibacteria group bacterium]|jgi:preprotein translocase subunit SecE
MNILPKISNYLKESIEEIKKVTWPTKKETRQYTILVIIVSLSVAIYLGLLDYIFNFLLELIIIK